MLHRAIAPGLSLLLFSLPWPATAENLLSSSVALISTTPTSSARTDTQLVYELAFGIVSWTMRYPQNAHASEIVGTTTMDLQKFDSDWKIVVLHTSFTEI